ncbi:LacI family DNA-binding transcriptional regulator [Croceicoccus ponticola]|uniref:LacI family DNA-binding transcriptional regulator n=1 Tax=Croceicoccus ponticola TaxID=2217664 RepID=A0A437GU08_9SPHN|nr:LacI family DNA-binding transcriptional regulator [Croceicoccus ponticola]RVQ64618.1 LacI family DNA-binding transcriptional regulator [Croceicoccus ponticola]
MTKTRTAVHHDASSSSGDPQAIGRMVTSYDVAKLAGVSQSAVSRCFTPGKSVSERMRTKIMRAADELGYQPNAIARMLITKRSNLIAVIVSNLSVNPDFASILSQHMIERGLNLLFFTLDQDADADRAIQQLWQYRVDGVISAAELSVEQIGVLRERGIPLVFINRLYDVMGANSVGCDHAEGEGWLIEKLVSAGHSRFGIVAGPEASVVSRMRLRGALDKLAALGCAAPQVVHSDFTYAGGREAMRGLCGGKKRPDAIVCANDLMAIGCIDEARLALSLKVPDDVSVVGFDGYAPGQWGGYQLTTVRQPVASMVKAAVDMLVARIEEPSMATEKRVFSGELVEGSSARID